MGAPIGAHQRQGGKALLSTPFQRILQGERHGSRQSDERTGNQVLFQIVFGFYVIKDFFPFQAQGPGYAQSTSCQTTLMSSQPGGISKPVPCLQSSLHFPHTTRQNHRRKGGRLRKCHSSLLPRHMRLQWKPSKRKSTMITHTINQVHTYS